MDSSKQLQYIKAIREQAKVLYADYIKKMKALDKRAHALMTELENQKVALVRSKIKKLK